MAFNTFRTPFEFVGQLEILKERQGANGKTIQGTIQTNEKGTYERIVFGTKLEKQGSILLEATAFNNPVSFTLNEVDNKGVNKKFEYKGGTPLTEEQKLNIIDLWKSTYTMKGNDVIEYHHSKDFINAIKSNIIKFVEKGGYFKITGNVEKSAYQGDVQERYVYNNIELLKEKPTKEYLKVSETVVYKRDDIKDSSMSVYQMFRVSTKQGYKEVWYKGDKTIRFDKNWLNNGEFDFIEIEDNVIHKGDIEHLKEFEKGKVCINYFPVIKRTEIEEKPDLSQLQGTYKIMYDGLIEQGLTEKANNLLNSLNSNIKVAEGGNNRHFYLNEFMFTDTNMEIIETVFDNEYFETTPNLINKAMEKNNKGKLNFDDIVINKKKKVDVSFDSFDNDNTFGSFEDNLKDKETTQEEVKEEKPKETKKEEFSFEEEMKKDDVAEEKQVEDKKEETKKEEKSKEVEKVKEKVEISEDTDDDMTEFPF